MKNSILKKSLVFILIVILSFLLFFGLGDLEKTTNELISFGFLIFSELLIFLSVILPSIKNKSIEDLLSASVLYTLMMIILNYIIRPSLTKSLIVWNVALFIIYLIIVIIVCFKKKK